jgi:transposase
MTKCRHEVLSDCPACAEDKIKILRTALQKIADLPATNHPTRLPIKEGRQRRIAISALRRAALKRGLDEPQTPR